MSVCFCFHSWLVFRDWLILWESTTAGNSNKLLKHEGKPAAGIRSGRASVPAPVGTAHPPRTASGPESPLWGVLTWPCQTMRCALWGTVSWGRGLTVLTQKDAHALQPQGCMPLCCSRSWHGSTNLRSPRTFGLRRVLVWSNPSS